MARKKKEPIPELPQPSPAVARAMAAAAEREAKRSPPPEVKLTRDGVATHLGRPHADAKGWEAHIRDVFGSLSKDFCDTQVTTLLWCLQSKSDELPSERELNAVTAFLSAAKAQNEIEAALAVQMAATHSLAMKLLGRTLRQEGLPQFEANGNMANKLLRTFTMQMDALAKMKRGGEQTVRVVHVHQGGQAVVANNVVHGGGGTPENSGRPHALALPSPDPERRPMPVVAGEGKEALPHARRGSRQRRTRRPA